MAAENHEYQLLFDESGIRDDLRLCRETDRYAFDRVVAVLGELRGNPSLSEQFVHPGFQNLVVEDVCWIASLAQEGIHSTRVKLWEVQAWRLIFFVDHRGRRAALAAVMHRDQNYEQDASLWQRLREAYERLGF
jgi:hypothetical protein